MEAQQTGLPLIQKSWLQQAQEGLIVLSGKQSDIGQSILASQRILAEALAAEWTAIFPKRFYLELQRTEREHDKVYIQIALEVSRAKALSWPSII